MRILPYITLTALHTTYYLPFCLALHTTYTLTACMYTCILVYLPYTLNAFILPYIHLLFAYYHHVLHTKHHTSLLFACYHKYILATLHTTCILPSCTVTALHLSYCLSLRTTIRTPLATALNTTIRTPSLLANYLPYALTVWILPPCLAYQPSYTLTALPLLQLAPSRYERISCVVSAPFLANWAPVHPWCN